MDVAFVIRQRLAELGCEQRALARAAVTESSISVRKNGRKKWGEPPTPLLQDVRVLILRTCPPDKTPDLRMVFAKQPFGETVLYAVRTSSLQAQLDNGANVLFNDI